MKSKKLMVLLLTPCLIASNISGLKSILANQNIEAIMQNSTDNTIEISPFGIANSGNVVNKNTGAQYETLESAIAEASENETLYVYPGDYDITRGSFIEGNNSWYLLINKPINIIGVDEFGLEITDANKTQARIFSTDYSENGGWDSQNLITIKSSNVKLQGLNIQNKLSPNKAIEVIGSVDAVDNFTMAYCKLSPIDQDIYDLVNADSKPSYDSIKDYTGSIYLDGEINNATITDNLFDRSAVTFESLKPGSSIDVENNVFDGRMTGWNSVYSSISYTKWGDNTLTDVTNCNININSNAFINDAGKVNFSNLTAGEIDISENYWQNGINTSLLTGRYILNTFYNDFNQDTKEFSDLIDVTKNNGIVLDLNVPTATLTIPKDKPFDLKNYLNVLNGDITSLNLKFKRQSIIVAVTADIAEDSRSNIIMCSSNSDFDISEDGILTFYPTTDDFFELTLDVYYDNDNYIEMKNLGTINFNLIPSVSVTKEVLITSESLNGLDLTQTRSLGHNDFITDGLKVWTEDTSSESKAAGYIPLKNMPLLSELQNIEFDHTHINGTDVSLQLIIQTDTEIAYLALEESYYASNKWWSNKLATLNKPGMGYNFYGTLEDIYLSLPNAKVLAVGYSLGSGAKGEAIINSITAYDTKYIFGDVIPVDSISLNEESISLVVGDMKTLVATVSPSNATNQNIIWASSDDSVAIVDIYGNVIVVGSGSATITATTEDGNMTSSCIVNVTEASIPITSFILNKGTSFLKTGETDILEAIITPTDATNQNVIWSSSDPSIVTVVDGKITALKAGRATITATSEDGKFTTYCYVTITDTNTTVLVNDITLKQATSLSVGDTETLITTISPLDATNQNVTWASSDNSVVSVDATGKITALKPGNATISVTTLDGNKTASCIVSVTTKTISVTNISLKSSTSLTVGGTEVLTPVISPLDATNQNVTWTSSDTSVVSVDATGKITALKPGNATISVTTLDGNKTASCIVTVNNIPVASITINSANYSNSITTRGGTLQLNASILPLNATDKNIIWSVNNSNATISNNGLVTAVSNGQVTVTAKDITGNIVATFVVNISNQNYTSNNNNTSSNSNSSYNNSNTDNNTNNDTNNVTNNNTKNSNTTNNSETVETIKQDQTPLGSENATILDDTTPLGSVENKISFNDVSKTSIGWALDAITYLADKKIVSGTGEGNFEPNRPITRAEFVMMIVKAFDLKSTEKTNTFTDVSASDWFFEAVSTGVFNKIISGYEDGTFKPNKPISREEMAFIINRLLGKYELKVDKKDAKNFKDQDQFSSFAKEAILNLSSYGIINGNENDFYEPKSNTLRAQSAVVVYNLLKATQK